MSVRPGLQPRCGRRAARAKRSGAPAGLARTAAVLAAALIAGCASAPQAERSAPPPAVKAPAPAPSPAPLAKLPPPPPKVESSPRVPARVEPKPAPPQVAIAPPSIPSKPPAVASLPAPSPEPVSPLEAESRELSALVSYAHRVSSLRSNAQRNVLSAAAKEFTREPGVKQRLRLALLLSLPGTVIHDDVRALALLDPLSAAGGNTPMTQFAALLHAQVESRVRDQKRLAQLREQLEGLRAIERSLNERERAVAR